MSVLCLIGAAEDWAHLNVPFVEQRHVGLLLLQHALEQLQLRGEHLRGEGPVPILLAEEHHEVRARGDALTRANFVDAQVGC